MLTLLTLYQCRRALRSPMQRVRVVCNTVPPRCNRAGFARFPWPKMAHSHANLPTAACRLAQHTLFCYVAWSSIVSRVQFSPVANVRGPLCGHSRCGVLAIGCGYSVSPWLKSHSLSALPVYEIVVRPYVRCTRLMPCSR